MVEVSPVYFSDANTSRKELLYITPINLGEKISAMSEEALKNTIFASNDIPSQSKFAAILKNVHLNLDGVIPTTGFNGIATNGLNAQVSRGGVEIG